MTDEKIEVILAGKIPHVEEVTMGNWRETIELFSTDKTRTRVKSSAHLQTILIIITFWNSMIGLKLLEYVSYQHVRQ